MSCVINHRVTADYLQKYDSTVFCLALETDDNHSTSNSPPINTIRNNASRKFVVCPTLVTKGMYKIEYEGVGLFKYYKTEIQGWVLL
jgi:hypothetical protein